MLRKFDDSGSGPEASSVFCEDYEYKSSTNINSKLNDSFDSSFLIPNGSELSFNSQDLEYEPTEPKPAPLRVPMTTKNQSYKKHSIPASRPVSILKTTFLPDDASNYDFPKKIDTKPPIHHSVKHEEKKVSEPNEYKNTGDSKISELENMIIKKDSLIETLRTRVAKMVDELEEVNRKKNIFKFNDNGKIDELGKKCEEYEKIVQGFGFKEKEYGFLVEAKSKENSDLANELKAKQGENECYRVKIVKLENELELVRDKNNALSLSISQIRTQKTELEQEVARLEILKNSQTNEFKILQEDLNRTISSLNHQLAMGQNESKNYQALLKDSQNNYDVLNRSYQLLSNKLQNLENQLGKIDECFRLPLQERKERHSQPTVETPKVLERQFTFNGCENCMPKAGHKKSHSSTSCSKNILREIIDVLEVSTSFEVIPAIKKLMAQPIRLNQTGGNMSTSDKKLIKKLNSLVKDCLSTDPSKEISASQIWRVVKKVFEDYSILLRHFTTSDMSLLRTLLGEGKWSEKITTLVQEHKILRDLFGKLRIKLKLPVNSTVSEIESAIQLIRST